MYRNIWEYRVIHGNTGAGIHVVNGNTWKYLGVHGMGTQENTREYKGIHVNTWEYTGIHGIQRNTREYIGIYGNAWEYMEIDRNT